MAGRLVLSRKVDEEVVMKGPFQIAEGEEIRVQVAEIKASFPRRVRLCFKAPEAVRIFRSELVEPGQGKARKDLNHV